MVDDPFQKAQDTYLRLRGQLSTGRITRQQFESALKQLMVQDAQGRYWTLHPNSGKWHVYDGQRWMEAAPPAARPTVLPERGSTARPDSLPERTAIPSPERYAPVVPSALPRTRHGGSAQILLVAFVGAIVILAVVMFGVALFITQQPSKQIAQATLPGSTPALTIAIPSVTGTPMPAIASSNAPGVRVSVASAPTPTPIAAKDFASLSALLANKIAAMNQAELKFIRDMRASSDNGRMPGVASPLMQKGSALTDQDLKDLAGKAMDVAILADQLGELAGKQDKGSQPAAQFADAFYAIARSAFSLALDAQNVRQALQSGSIPGGQAIDVVAQYGVQLWNSAVTDGNTKGNPFSAQTKNGGDSPASLNPSAASQVQSQTNAGNSLIWIAQSASQSTKTINVLAAQSPVQNPFDPQVLNSLTTADGQNDGNKAQQVAAANLQRLGATANSSDPSKPSQLQVLANSVAVSGDDQVKAGNLPTFRSGTATVISNQPSAGDNAFMNLFGLNGDQPPSDQGRTSVQDAPSLVDLRISNVVIKNVDTSNTQWGEIKLGAWVHFDFTVSWSTTLAQPRFWLSCKRAGYAGNREISESSGVFTVNDASEPLLVYPGEFDLWCEAERQNGAKLGVINVDVLVGDTRQITNSSLSSTSSSSSSPSSRSSSASSSKSSSISSSNSTSKSSVSSSSSTKSSSSTQNKSFTMNGVFNMRDQHAECAVPALVTGILKINVDSATGQASGTLTGGGSYTGQYRNCTSMVLWATFSMREDVDGNFTGTIKNGAVSLTGNIAEHFVATPAGCPSPCPVGPSNITNSAPINLTGTFDSANHTGKGTLRMIKGGGSAYWEGDWQAGE